jgi:hypothetical protein
VIVLAEGRLVGRAAPEAHPAEVMDLTFATQALATERQATTDPLPPGVHPVRRPSRSGWPGSSWPPSGCAATTSPRPAPACAARPS